MSQNPTEEWQPDPAGLEQVFDIVQMVRQHDRYNERSEKLAQFNQLHDFNNYLCWLFVHWEDGEVDGRLMSAVILKDNIIRYWATLAPDVQTYITNSLPTLLGHSNQRLRDMTGTVITEIVARTLVAGWPYIFVYLVDSLDTKESALLSGCFSLLSKLAEDHGRELCKPEANDIMNNLIPKILLHLESGEVHRISGALHVLHHLIPWQPRALLLDIKRFFQCLFDMADNPPTEAILEQICLIFSQIVVGRMTEISEHMNEVVTYMLNMTNYHNPSVALAASTFWSTIASTEICYSALTGRLPEVVSTLVRNMKYSEEELNEMPDMLEDVSFGGANEDHSNFVHGKIILSDAMEAQYDNSLMQSQYSLRTSCAAALDELSEVFGDEILDPIISIFQSGLQSEDYLDCEAVIMALGATSGPFLEYGTDHLIGIVPMLFNIIDNAHPLVRYITTWTINRFSRWIVDQDNMLQPTVDYFNRRLHIEKKRTIAEMTLSSLAVLCDDAVGDMAPYLDMLAETLFLYLGATPSSQPAYDQSGAQIPSYEVNIANSVSGRTLVLVFDVLGALVASVGDTMLPYLPTLMEITFNFLGQFDNNSTYIISLFDCLSRIVQSSGLHISDYAEGIWGRPFEITNQYVLELTLSKDNPDLDEPDPKFAGVSLELLDSFLIALETAAADVFAQSTILSDLSVTVTDSAPSVLRGSFTVIADLARVCFGLLEPVLEHFLPALIRNIRPRVKFITVSSNAAWALSEIAHRASPSVLQLYAEEITKRTILIIMDSSQHTSYHANCATLLGRICIHFPDFVASHQSYVEIFETWAGMVSNLEDLEEKRSATFGILSVMRVNPIPVLEVFDRFIYIVNSWISPPPNIKAAFQDILTAYSTQLDQQVWQNVLGSLEKVQLQYLGSNYTL